MKSKLLTLFLSLMIICSIVFTQLRYVTMNGGKQEFLDMQKCCNNCLGTFSIKGCMQFQEENGRGNV